MAATGPRNLITDVAGILVGQPEDRDGITGTTVVLAAQRSWRPRKTPH